MAEVENVSERASAAQDQHDEVPGQLMTQVCQPCSKRGKETTADVFCPTCNELQCTECSNGHQIYTFMQKHKLVDANAPREEPIVHNMGGLDRCEKHETMVKFFCKDDEKLCCSTCAIIEHRKCNHVEEIKNLNINESYRDLALKVEINEMKESSTAAVKHWTDGKKQMQGQLQNVLGHLTAIRMSVNKKVEDFEENVKQQATSVFEMKAIEYGDHQSKCEETVSVLERNLEILDAVRRHGSPEQQFITQQRVKESLVKTDEKASQEMTELECTEICLELNQKLESLLDSTEKLGALKTSTSKINIGSIFEGRPVKLKKIMSIELQHGEEDEGKPHYTGMDFLPDGRLVAVDNSNDKCIVLSERFEQLGSCELSGSPHSVVIISEDEVAITSITYIYFFRDDDNFVVGTYDDNKPVRIVSLSGEEEDFNIDFPAKKYDVGSSTSTYIKNSGKVIVTDWDAHTVYIYTIKDNTSISVKDDQIRKPTSVAIGPFDSIFVCSKGTNSVVQISQTGQILSSHKLDIQLPYRVCVSKDRTKLAVLNSARGVKKLQLFSMDV